MQKTEFLELLFAIPPERWEETLAIGDFRELQVLEVMKRPFSLIARARVEGKSGEGHVFIKVYRNLKNRPREISQKKVARDFQASRFWYEKFSDGEEFRVVKPLLAMPEQLLVVTEETAGENLFQLIQRKAAFSPSRDSLQQLQRHLYQVGAWLRHKQTLLTVETGRFSVEELLEYLNVRLELLTEDPRRRFPREYRDRIRRFIERYRFEIPGEDFLVTTCHSDFNPGNIIVDGDRVTVLDFGRLVEGSYLLDLSKLYFQLYLFTLKPQYRSSVVEALQQSLLEGFGDGQADQRLIFKFLTLRNILTHLTNISRFWKVGLRERLYNRWVMHKELKKLHNLLQTPYSGKAKDCHPAVKAGMK